MLNDSMLLWRLHYTFHDYEWQENAHTINREKRNQKELINSFYSYANSIGTHCWLFDALRSKKVSAMDRKFNKFTDWMGINASKSGTTLLIDTHAIPSQLYFGNQAVSKTIISVGTNKPVRRALGTAWPATLCTMSQPIITLTVMIIFVYWTLCTRGLERAWFTIIVYTYPV